jgi:hypothetical protein
MKFLYHQLCKHNSDSDGSWVLRQAKILHLALHINNLLFELHHGSLPILYLSYFCKYLPRPDELGTHLIHSRNSWS